MTQTDWEDKYKRLSAEYDELNAEYTDTLKSIAFAKQVLLSFGLAGKIESYRLAASKEQPFPEPEFSDMMAGVTNRALIGSILGLVLAFGTLFILFRQTSVFSKQTEVLEIQQLQTRANTLTEQRKDAVEKLQAASCEKSANLFSALEKASFIDGVGQGNKEDSRTFFLSVKDENGEEVWSGSSSDEYALVFDAAPVIVRTAGLPLNCNMPFSEMVGFHRSAFGFQYELDQIESRLTILLSARAGFERPLTTRTDR